MPRGPLGNVTDYRHDEATRKNNPPAKIAAEGTVPIMPKIRYEYSPRLAPALRFDSTGQADGAGSAWTWIALDADSKLVVAYLTGGRDASWAHAFMCDVAGRLTNRVQLTTDGHRCYVEAVEGAFGMEIDYAMLVKIYGSAPEKPETRYSPAQIIETRLTVITGDPDPRHISTSYVERQNLSMRMSMRRFTRLTNAFSKKIENLRHAVALNYMHYNFCRIHQTLRVTPAMQAGIADHVWSLEELVGLLERRAERAA